MTAGPLARRAFVEQIMGMPVSIHVRGADVAGANVAAAVAAVFAELREVDETFSTYREDSEITRLQRGKIDLPACSAVVHEVAARCDEARARTDGAFDARRLAPDGRPLFDPTGLVKAWATERAARHLDAVAGHDYCLNAGGDVIVGGDLAGAEPWRVAVERPFHPEQIIAVLTLQRGAVATSGIAHRGRHIIDPATGLAADKLQAATVTGPTLLWSDVYATAAFVLGTRAVAFVAAQDGYEAIIVDAAGGVSCTAGLLSQGGRDRDVHAALDVDVAG